MVIPGAFERHFFRNELFLGSQSSGMEKVTWTGFWPSGLAQMSMLRY